MKKIALFVTALAVSLSIGGRVLADTDTATLADKAGITPDNTILYPIDKSIDDLKISMASDDDKKAQALADVAEERLGESEVMNDKGKIDLANQTMNEYNDKITEAQNNVEDDIDKASNSTTDNTTKLDELKKLETTITDRQMKSIEVLKNIESKVSGNAKETIAQVIEMQTKKKEAIAAVIKERQTLLQNKKAVKEAEKNLKQAKKTGDEQAIKAAEDTLTKAQLTLTTQNKKFTQVIEAKKEAMKGGVGQLKKEAKKEQTKDSTSSTNNTDAEDTNTTVTAPAQNNETSTTTTTNADTNTTDTTSTTQGTVDNNATITNNTKTDITIKEGKGIKNPKEVNVKGNGDQNTKSDKENNSTNKNRSNH
ncbi:DUF5667 domain-containing protein [Clostridium sp. WILCCON 0269]|uniref:DUF5667 domain-containing protein n=1 Tax=Candidatus Clostridium eludens TaxID=3381663 RepID=A0ABW8SGW4_9CLOT